MFKRCVIISLRNPETLLTATLIPFCLILLFGTVFGSISDVGDYNYIDFIVPGIILQSIAQASQYSAMNITADMTDVYKRQAADSVESLVDFTLSLCMRSF